MTAVFSSDGTEALLPRAAGPPARRGSESASWGRFRQASSSADRESDGFAECYAASYQGLATQLYVYTGDLGLAQDLVQEAFCRALPRWTKLSTYDDPVAWVLTQTGGPRTFGPNPKVTDLAMTANDLVMTRQPDGRWHGTLTIDISNAGHFAVPATIRLSGTAVLGGDGGSGWDRCDRIPVSTVPIEQIGTSCQLGTVQVGQSRRLSVRFVTPFSPTGTLRLYVGYENSDGEGYPDRADGNNQVRPVVRAG